MMRKKEKFGIHTTVKLLVIFLCDLINKKIIHYVKLGQQLFA